MSALSSRPAGPPVGRSRIWLGVPFGRHAPRCESEQPGGDDERSVRACKHLAKGFDGAAIRIDSTLEVS